MENIEQENSQTQALRNPIILENIIQHKLLSGTTSRLVSQFWNEITLSLPRPKLTLRVHTGKNCHDPSPFQEFCMEMEPRLARSIAEHENSLFCSRCKLNPSILAASMQSKLVDVSSIRLGQIIENFSLTCVHPDLIPTLYEILGNCCPNLKRLEIGCCSENPDEQEPEARANSRLNKLISLKIYDSTGHRGYFKMTQWLLNSAPDLTHYFHLGNQLPDLSRNKSIKMLDLTVVYASRSDHPSADYIRSTHQILNQVKDSVEFLYLRAEAYVMVDEEAVTSDPIDLQIPKLKNLKVFGNFMLDLFGCGDNLQNICTARIPTLQSLRISASHRIGSNLKDLLRNITEEKDLFSGIKNLHVENLHDPELIAGLKTPFPNLERLSITHRDKNACPFISMEPYLRAYASLGLKFLEMELRNDEHEKFSHFIRGFSNCRELLSGLKDLKIRFNLCNKHFFDDLDLVRNEMEEWLMRMRGLEDVHISGIKFKDEAWNWMDPFIKLNEIPIVFERD